MQLGTFRNRKDHSLKYSSIRNSVWSVYSLILAGICLFKVNNRKQEQCVKSSSMPSWKYQETSGFLMFVGDIEDVVLVSLFSILNIFHLLFRCFHCWFRTSKCRQENELNVKNIDQMKPWRPSTLIKKRRKFCGFFQK